MRHQKNKSKKIFLTFDYELFFSSTGSIENCLLRPTADILEVFKELNMVGTFFIDVLYLKRLGEIFEERENYLKIIKQLQQIVGQGSRIELHMHSHWLDAIYDNGNWTFSTYDRYMLQSLNQLEIEELFDYGICLLNSVAREVKPDYCVTAFRAGGWCILPFDKLRPVFLKHKILIDTSVAPGLSEYHARKYDFSASPNKEFWRFSNSPIIEDVCGEFIELPILTYQKKVYHRIYERIFFYFKKDQIYGDGIGIVDWKNKSLFGKIKQLLCTNDSILSVDNLSVYLFRRKLMQSGKNSLIIISHPKTVLKNNGIKNIRMLAEYRCCNVVDVLNSDF